MSVKQIDILKTEVTEELVHNILPFWIDKMTDAENGGFYGRIDGQGNLFKDADKGSVLNARILWTFSAAYRILGNSEYLKAANRAKDYLLHYFLDKKNGGIFWLLDSKGNKKDGKKQIYAQAFAIYGLVEYYKVTEDKESLDEAIDLFRMIEKHSFDENLNGYFEAFTMEWGNLDDLRLSEKDANEKKTMNTHLHILEAYTNLYRVWKDDFLRKQLGNLINIFLKKILNPGTYSLNLFFDEYWNDKSELVSYGHNIESSWLIYEAAKVLGDENIIMHAREICLKIADASKEGKMPDGGMIYEKFFRDGKKDTDRHWWVQAETVIGFLNAYELSGNEEYLELSLDSWNFIKKNLIDHNRGEWFWSVDNDHKPNMRDDKAGFWKCPYHNSRMCFEIIHRYK